jgi:cytochrome c-type biogenesis protein CcmH/NrfG
LKGAYPEAEQAYGNANRLHSAALNPVLGLLNVAEAMKDGARIQRAAEAVLRVDPSNYRANMALGGRGFALKDYRGAAFAYRRVLNIYPDDVDARSGVAWAAFYTGDSHEALAQFQTILNIYPDYPFAKQGFKLVAGANGGGVLAR